MEPSPARTTDVSAIATEIRVRYVAALIDGDRPRATAAIDEALDRDLDTPVLLLQVLGRSEWELGELWHRGDLTIAQEHWGTQATREEIERVLQRRKPVRDLGRSVIVAMVPGEVHTVPARIVAGLFAWRGWRVDYLGTATPPDELVEYVRERRPDLVALSITLASNRQAATMICSRLRRMPSAPPILIGGAGVADLDADAMGADATARDALAGLQTAAELVGLGGQRDLDSYLAVVGQRIHRHRRSAGLSQSALADRSGLTRPYLSAVERGRQNITLGAALKIAGALEVGMSELLDEQRL